MTELFLHDQKNDTADCRYSIQSEAGGVLFLFNECGITAREVFETFKAGHAAAWKCAARAQNTGPNDPADCAWPGCGCDPYASKVIEALEEACALRAMPLQGHATEARRLVDEQAKDEGLWFHAQTCAEAYLQAALRKLHAAVEGQK